MIKDQIYSVLFEEAKSRKITDLRIGLHYSCVELDNKDLGVAYTPKDNFIGGCCSSVYNNLLIDKSSDNALVNISSDNHYASTIALATVNALVNNSVKGFEKGDILDVINLQPDDNVAMIGYFSPIISALQNRINKLFIFDKHNFPESYTTDEIKLFIPDCQVTFITATSIINNDIDKYVQLASHCREIVILGASTPLVKDVFAPLNVTILSGVQVTNKEIIKQIISHGGGMRHFKDYIKKINLRCSL